MGSSEPREGVTRGWLWALRLGSLVWKTSWFPCHAPFALVLALKVKTNEMFYLFRSGTPKLQVWHWAVGLCECLRGDMGMNRSVSHSCGLSQVEGAGGTEGG